MLKCTNALMQNIRARLPTTRCIFFTFKCVVHEMGKNNKWSLHIIKQMNYIAHLIRVVLLSPARECQAITKDIYTDMVAEQFLVL